MGVTFLCSLFSIRHVTESDLGYRKILTTETDNSKQTVKTKIRLLHEPSDHSLHCLPVHLHLLNA